LGNKMKSQLIDQCGRIIDYLRVSITDLCNLRCVYCRPPEGVQLVTHEEILRYEEIITVLELAVEMGIRKVRITGGEPLVRRGVVDFIGRVNNIPGIKDVGLTTNGVRVKELARRLVAAGLKRINISLDSLRRDTFQQITGRDELDRVLAGIHTAIEAGMNPVKINVVLLEGINEPDVAGFAHMTKNLPVDVRFIERMPFGEHAPPGAPSSFSAQKVVELIRQELGELHPVGERQSLDGPATLYKLDGAKGRIGVIDPVTGHFCGTCNRLRLTARGTLRPCLLGSNEIDIKSAIRSGASRQELADVIRAAVAAKPPCGGAQVQSDCEAMNLIGG
jgi:cyclic pyranopterin phosphate synthase